MEFKENTTYRITLVNGKTYEGKILPSTTYNLDSSIIIKLTNGYNVAINKKDIKEAEEIKGYKKEKPPMKNHYREKESHQKVLVVSVGGTILSKVEYETGGVVASFDAQDILENIPSWYESTFSFITYEIMNEMSENLTPHDWETIAKSIVEYYRKHKDVKGIIVFHGTDTMHYTSAALSFTLPSKIDVPVVLVGAQRSSDRPSSDGLLNFLASLEFIKHYDGRGVFVCMHANVSDEVFSIHLGSRVRKMHTSRRDAFKSINYNPIAHVKLDLKTKTFKIKHNIKINCFPPAVNIRFSHDVGIIKYYPGMKEEELEAMIRLNPKGIIIEGTGLGHINVKKLLKVIEKYAKDMFIGMTSQTIYGSVHPYVYKNLRLLSKSGVVYLKDMISEVAYVKLSLATANFSNLEKIKEFMTTPLCEECDNRELL